MTIGEALQRENGQHPYSRDRSRAMIYRLLNERGGLIGVIGETDDLKGCVALMFDQVWYSEDWQLVELFAVVREDCRSAELGYAQALLDFAKWASDQFQLDLTIGVLSDHRMAAKVRLYARKLPKAGEFFCYRPKKVKT